MKTHSLRYPVLGGALLAAATLLVATGPSQAQPQVGRLTVQVNQPGVKISPMFYGMMTEEINHAYDGGLYAELIQNRVFKDDARNPAHWTLLQKNGSHAAMSLDTTQPIPSTALTTCLRIDVMNAGAANGSNVGVSNEGYWGVPVIANQTYQVSLWAKASPGLTGGLKLAFESQDGQTTYSTGTVAALSGDWKKYTLTMTGGTAAPNTLGRFAIYAQGNGTLWLNQVSVMPPTYKNRPNGLRSDLMEKMAGLKPAYLRLPGGNYLEGITLQDKFDWKTTIGPIEQRPGHMGTWGYRSSDGLGMMEYLSYWCDDLGIQPVLAVHAGYALNGTYVHPGPDLQPYVQEALDEIEFLIGDANSTWGKRRAELGHPAPFKLTYVEIGNEDWFDRSGSYDGRYSQFYTAIKAKYPQLQLIATAGVKSRKPDVIDDHYYRSAQAMASDSKHYDNTDRNGPKIFVGEWASTEGSPTPTLKAALGDAAWLTGLERNSDVVVMQCYAPLFVNVNPGARQWGTNLIGYDALRSFGSPSYYVQSMFGQNTGDVVLPSQASAPPIKQGAAPTGKIGVGTWLTQAEFKDIKVTDPAGKSLYQKDFATGNADWQSANGQWSTADSVLKQTGTGENARTTAGDVSWTDYTLTLKARKTGGQEGFLILVHAKDNDNYVWWNLGGWGNTRSAFEKSEGGQKSEMATSDTTIETGRWYDIKIEVKGRQIKGYLDGKLIATANDEVPASIYTAASRDTATGDVILKVVNFTEDVQPTQIDLQGVKNLAATATGQIISGEYGDVNSIDNPEKVTPKPVTITGVKPSFRYDFPARSVAVLRFKTTR